MGKEVKIMDLNQKPKKVKWFLKPILVLGSFIVYWTNNCHIKKINTKGLKWPYIIVASHAAFLDFAIDEVATFPHSTSYICSIEEFIGREGLLRGISAFPKRKYTKDVRPVKHSLHLLKKKKNTVTVYAEARYTICGVNERIDHSIGKFVKTAGVPLVVLLTHGDYLSQPHWDQKHTRKLRHEAEFICIATKEEVASLLAEEIQERLEKTFVYDEYQWQFDNKIKIKSKYRCNNLHNALYKCPHCNKDYSMNSRCTEIWCEECGIKYEMDEYSRLHCVNGEGKFEHVPDWYRWEREEVRKEVRNGTYSFEDDVRIEHLINAKKGLSQIGHIRFKHDLDGLHLHGQLDDGSSFDFDNAPINTPSIHVEYDFKKKGTVKQGQAIDINTPNDTWFIYPQTDKRVLTKIHLAVEEIYDLVTENK